MICTESMRQFAKNRMQCAWQVFNFQFSIFVLFILAACSGSGDEVSIGGRLLHMNQATFYVYSIDGTIDGIDTITVQGGRFEYDREISHAGTLVIVFPNYSQMPVFVKPGTSVSIKGDAARLREVKVEGDGVNEDFTDFRVEHLNASPDQMKRATADYVNSKDCNSEIALWLIQQHCLAPQGADTKEAVTLLKVLAQRDGDNVKVKRLLNQLLAVGTVNVGDRIEAFTATDIDGNRITEKMLAQGKCVVMTCALWNYDSQSMLRRLATRNDGKVIAVCLEVDRQDARELQNRCNAKDVTMVCDSTQWDNPLLRTFGLSTIPDNVVIENGRVTKRNVPVSDL